ncbi:MAG: FAD-dependent monooxygenase [Wenzhouxiangella sp.]
MRREAEVLVAGGGAAGAAAALLLARADRRVVLFDRRRPDTPAPNADFDPRVVALSPGSVRILEAVGAWERIDPARVAPYSRMQVHAQDWSVRFSAGEHGLEYLGWIVEVPALQHALWQALDDSATATVMAPDGVSGHESGRGRVRVRLESAQTVRAQVLVAADGARSRLRRRAGIATEQWHYNQHALVTHVATERPNPGVAWQRFTEHGPLALLPLPDGRSSIVWSLPSNRAAALRDLDDPAFLAELDASQDSPFGSVTSATRRYTFPLIRRRSLGLVAGRTVLLGDAARTVHPLAGQGLNLGLADAAALAEVYSESDIDRSLAHYERWRLSAGTVMAGGIHAINELSAGGNPGRRLMGAGFGLVGRAWPLRELFVRRACGIDSDAPALARGGP